MRVIDVKSKEEMGQVAAEILIEKINNKSDSVLGLATGSSPLTTYAHLVRAYREKKVSFSTVSTFNLDEYAGLSEKHKNSYNYFMMKNLFDYINIKRENIHIPNGSGDITKNCEDYKRVLEAHNIDIQLLGLGVNGHIGFNEPGVDFELSVHVEELNEQTISDNSVYFNSIEDVPTMAITMGIADIMKAKKIILLVNDKRKKRAFEKLMSGNVDINWPVSILNKHDNVNVIVVRE